MRRTVFLERSKKQEQAPSTSSLSPIFVALITASAVAAASLITAYASRETADQQWAQSCIKRLDDQEVKIRDKASVFMNSLADYVTRPMNPKLPASEAFSIAEKVIRSGFEFSAYTPDELGVQTLRVAMSIHDKLSAKSDAEYDKAQSAAVDAVRFWPVKYASYMAELEKKRAECQK